MYSQGEKPVHYRSGSTDISSCQFGNFRLLGQGLLNLNTTFNFMAQTDHNFFMMFYHSFIPAQGFQMHKNIKCAWKYKIPSCGFLSSERTVSLWQKGLRSPVSKLPNARERKGREHAPFHAHADAFSCYVQIVFVITEAVSSEMPFNLLMCIG